MQWREVTAYGEVGVGVGHLHTWHLVRTTFADQEIPGIWVSWIPLATLGKVGEHSTN